jgi:hypothetical protein
VLPIAIIQDDGQHPQPARTAHAKAAVRRPPPVVGYTAVAVLLAGRDDPVPDRLTERVRRERALFVGLGQASSPSLTGSTASALPT